ncbi:MAG: alpha/beta hydrolase [Bacteroidetes bacterium]|nr:alpha/beta hydrolase [Bacteroidota bacterium]
MQSKINSKTVVFLHGLFMNPKSWTKWVQYFQNKGYKCYTPAYPFHEGQPAELRQNIDPELGKLTLGDVIEKLEDFIGTLPDKPILIGHSMGGLAVQKLIELGLGVAGICLNPAPPKGVLSFKYSFLKANFPTINPLKGNTVCLPTPEWFHYAFCNTMSIEETLIEYAEFVVPESRNIPRSSTGQDGTLDFSKPHAPLLIIAGEKDHIIPKSLNRRNAYSYTDRESVTDFKVFPGRTHYICGQKGWEEVADYIFGWIKQIQ